MKDALTGCYLSGLGSVSAWVEVCNTSLLQFLYRLYNEDSVSLIEESSMSKRRLISLRWRTLIPPILMMLSSATAAYLLVIGTAADVSPSVQQAFAIGAALFGGMMTLTLFLLINAATRRVTKITETTQALRSGHQTARTGMQPIDEIGKLGRAVDQYADYVQNKQDELRTALRKKRRELAHMVAVLESLPDGVIVQDLDGRVILMNEIARKLLGSARVFRTTNFQELTALVTDKLGPTLLPGVYALGDPKRVELDGKVLSAQAAAVMSPSDYQLGTVLLLRDITDHVRRERTRDAMLGRMSRDVQQPLIQLARNSLQVGGAVNVNDFARELTRHAFALQKMIVELRDVGEVDETVVQRVQKPLQLETLIWAVSNEWRQIAQANKLQLQVMINQKGLFILGDERRLRWAIGNLIDNAIKYTPSGGIVTLEVRGEEKDHAQLRIRDNGVGILPEEQSNLFTRFWRGTPTTPEGRVIRVPGMGQGLYIARQIIEAHGGAIQIRSKPGVGTAVYFTLPLTASEGLQLPHMVTGDFDGETIPLTARLSDDI
jgi:signal transduction histidine kinase